MFLKNKPNWQLSESDVTPQQYYESYRRLRKSSKGENSIYSRRNFLKSALALGMAGYGIGFHHKAFASLPNNYFPAPTHSLFDKANRPLTNKDDALSYCNFYEFGSHKDISYPAQAMQIDPWRLEITGLVDKPMVLGLDDIYRLFPPEERIYRLRCVEAWAMTVPWTGFALHKLLALVSPKSDAKYISFETLADKETMPGLKAHWYPWPYREAINIDEAKNELSFLATGLYGAPLEKQNGAPIRLVLPWKYGFKSIKSIVRIHVSATRTPSFWEATNGDEYGFWANVNPDVPHPRWSQATERLLSSGERVPTEIYNGYGEFVADLYAPYLDRLGALLYR